MMDKIRNKKIFFMTIFATVMVLMLVNVLFSATPMKVNYQGTLKEGGQLVTGIRRMKFQFYTTPTGGTPVWSTNEVNVEVRNGVFRYVIDLSSANINWNGGPYYLQVIVEGTPLTPREEINSTVYAIQAKTVDDGAITNSKLADNAVTPSKIKQGEFYDIIAATATSVDWNNIKNKPSLSGALGEGSVTTYHILDGTITDADISPTANIAWSKIDSNPLPTDRLQGNYFNDVKVSSAIYADKAASLESGNYLNDVKVSSAIYADNSAALGGQTPAYYTNASNLSAGIVPSDRLSGNYFNDVKVSSAIYADRAGSVTLGADSVGSYHIIDSTITDADISPTANIAWTKIDSNPLPTDRLQGNYFNDVKVSSAIYADKAASLESGNYLNDVKVSSAIYADNSAALGGQTPAYYTNASNLSAGIVPSDRLSGNYLNDVKVSSAIYADTAGSVTLGANSVGSSHIIDSTITDADISPTANISWSKINKVGSSLADLAVRDASALNTGTLDDARLSANVTKLGSSIGPGELESGNYFNDVKVSSAIYADKAASLESGNYLNDVKVSSAIYADNSAALGGQTPAYYTNASNLSAGIVPSARLSGNYFNDVKVSSAIYADKAASLESGNYLNDVKVSSAIYADNSAALGGQTPAYYTNASNLSAGIVPSARLSGNYFNDVKVSSAIYADKAASLESGNYLNDVKVSSAIYADNSAALGGQTPAYYTNASNLSAGIVPSARLSGNYLNDVKVSSAIYADKAASLESGNYLNDVKVSSAIYADNSAALGGQTPAYYTNASNLSAGIVPSDRLSGNYFNDVKVSSAIYADTAGSVVAVSPSIDVSTINATSTTPYGGINITTNTFIQGNVGIGTTNPQAKLHVSGGELWLCNDGQSPRIIIGDNGITGNYGYLQWDSGSKYYRIETEGTNGLKIKGNNVAIGNLYPSQPLIVGVGDTELFRIQNDGNIGIGTTSPGAKLHVAADTGFSGDIITISTGTSVLFRFNTSGSNAYADGAWVSGGADYAEWFEKEGEVKPGDIVGLNLSTGKVRKYQPGDVLVGICSSNPGFIGNNPINKSEKEMRKNYVLVGLVGQLDFNRKQVKINGKKVETEDGKLIGYLLNNGKLLLNIKQ